jgi:hypothetical protein
MLKKPPWISIIGTPGGDPTFGPISLSESMHGYFVSNASNRPKDRPKREGVDQDCASLCSLGDETTDGSVIERRSVLRYVQFGHNTGQHCKLRLALICGGKLTSQGYYRESGRKPDQKQIGEVRTHHVSSTSVSMYARTSCRS